MPTCAQRLSLLKDEGHGSGLPHRRILIFPQNALHHQTQLCPHAVTNRPVHADTFPQTFGKLVGALLCVLIGKFPYRLFIVGKSGNSRERIGRENPAVQCSLRALSVRTQEIKLQLRDNGVLTFRLCTDQLLPFMLRPRLLRRPQPKGTGHRARHPYIKARRSESRADCPLRSRKLAEQVSRNGRGSTRGAHPFHSIDHRLRKILFAA